MLKSEIYISLPSVEVAEDKSFWSSLRSKVDAGVSEEAVGHKQVVLQAISLITALSQGFSLAGVNDIISIMVDDNVVYLDTLGRDDDLNFALHSVLKSKVDQQSFQKVSLVLEHRVDQLHLVIEAGIHSTYQNGAFPMRVVLMGRVNSLRIRSGERADAYAARIRDFVRSETELQAFRDQLTQQTMGIARGIEASLPGCPLKVAKTIVQIPRLESAQIQELGQLPLGGTVAPPSYRPTPDATSFGGMEDRYEYFYHDPYNALLNWCLLDAMLTERTWNKSHIRVLHATGATLHRADELPEAVRGYGDEAYPTTVGLGLGRSVAPNRGKADARGEKVAPMRTQPARDSVEGEDGQSFLNRKLDYEVKRAKRYGRTIGLALLELDDLPSIREQLGPNDSAPLGRWVHSRLQTICRDTDILCHVGSGRYAIIMPEVDTEGAGLASARLRREMAPSADREGLPNTPVSISIGVAVLLHSQSNSARPFLAIAEQCLKKAKGMGANESVVIEARI